MSRVVELLCSRRATAGRGTGADVDRFCWLQRRYVDAPFAKSRFPIPLHRRKPPARCRRPRSNAANFRNIPGRNQHSISPRRCRRRSAAPQSYPAASTGVSGGGRGVASYAPPAHPHSRPPAASRRARSRHRPRPGGTTIIVGTSDTLEILARRYNVSAAAIMQANGYKGPRALSPGQQLIIPHPAAAVAAAPALAAPVEQAGCRGSAAPSRPCRQSRRHAAQHRAPQPCLGRRNWPRPITSMPPPSSSSA